MFASEDLTSLTLAHDSVTSIAHDHQVGDRDLSNAKLLRSGFVEFLENQGRPRDAARLKEEGPEGYPEMDDLQFLARMLGSQTVHQTNDVQIVYGDGPLYMYHA